MSRYDFSDRLAIDTQRERTHLPDRRLSVADPIGGLGDYPHSIDSFGSGDSLLSQEDLVWKPLELEGAASGRGGGGGGDGLWNAQSRHSLYSPSSVSPQSQSRLAAFTSSPISSFSHNHRPSFSPQAAFSHASGQLYSHQQPQQHFPPASSSSPDPLLQSATARSLPNNQSSLSFSLAGPSVGSHQRTSFGGQAHQSVQPLSSLRSTLWWGELEPWMDEEYARQVCNLMGWDQVNVTIPQPSLESAQSQQANNPGYCFLTFPSPQHAAAVLAQMNNAAISSGSQPILPNSNKPFVLNWATSPTTSPSTQNFPIQPQALPQNISNLPPPAPSQEVQSPLSDTTPNQVHNQNQKEYSIFVGDLAPETSNSDLVAVFRNPVLGLRNDRAPKFIRPFYSCKSAKIMLDPVTGVSRGYGFVRFTEEADQQRALIEMHGLYCLSRPMRISPATAKFKTAGGSSDDGANAAMSNSRSGSSLGSSSSIPSLTASTTASSMSSNGQPTMTLEALAQLIANASLGDKAGEKRTPSISAPLAPDPKKFDEALKHQEQARAILGNLVGPNGEQLTSTDPYNTTVFVGGLSPLISEETLRTFFAPFGDIHYVKVPAGKHCGFVQFVRKVDAERAIERMQGFPIGGSRIRLSWGRSQYKAAQAAAQAAAAAQAQATLPSTGREASALTPEQAMEILQKLGFSGILPSLSAQAQQQLQQQAQQLTQQSDSPNHAAANQNEEPVSASTSKEVSFETPYYNAFPSSSQESRFGGGEKTISRLSSGFSPFSPDPNYLVNLVAEREANALRGTKSTSHRFGNLPRESPTGERLSVSSSSGSIGARSVTPSGNNQKDPFFSSSSRPIGPIKDAPARPSSGQSKSGKDNEATVDASGTRTSQVWEGGADMVRSPTSTTDSNGSVQFRTSMSSSTAGSP